MNAFGVLFALISSIFLFGVPRRWALLPLLTGTVYMTVGQVVEIGPFHFDVIRLLVAVGWIRVFVKGEKLVGKRLALDWMMILWAIWGVISSLFHEKPLEMLVSMLGLAYDGVGLYFLMRVFIEDEEAVLLLAKAVCIALVPVALEMISEKITGHNSFAALGYVTADVLVRHGKLRAQGPFAHSILAGTAGAVCMPLALLLWSRDRKLAVLGLLATGTMVITSTSSGPIMTAAACFGAMFLWRYRNWVPMIRWGCVLSLVALNFIMKDPVYYLLARIDLTGSSTGWHRAALIGASIKYLNEWWLFGTDYTRHWMPTGVYWTSKHTDITNHYLKMGVDGGMLLMFLFIGIVVAAFVAVSRAIKHVEDDSEDRAWLMWVLGCILFGHAVTFVSVSYFDQTIVFFYLVLAAIGSYYSAITAEPSSEEPPEDSVESEDVPESVVGYG
ncbi:MAG: O-antigen ligase family protein [Candidatus Dormibacteraceae bacterium]